MKLFLLKWIVKLQSKIKVWSKGRMRKKILLGFEVGTGAEVGIAPSHLIVTGITQLSGKTTTLEALISRSDMTAIAFKTKPGETGFSQGKIIPPFFVEKSDWQYVESLLEATLKERLKFERSWIMTACRGATALEDVHKNIKKLLKESRENSLRQSVYTTLDAYFELVVPQLKNAYFSKELELKERINIMDLEKFSDEVQALVIRSVLEHVLKNRSDTVVIIPECWKFIPESRGSPVKYPAEALIRQGATKGNFVWFDSQDMAGVDKIPLKQVSNWILGMQMERNEVQHTLDQIPLPSSLKPKTEKIMTLKIGHFIVCNPSFTKEVYVMPPWLNKEVAKQVAMGKLAVENVMDRKKVKIQEISYTQEALVSSLRDELRKSAKRISELEKDGSILSDRSKRFENEVSILKKARAVPIEKYNELKDADRKYSELLNFVNKFLEKFQKKEFAAVTESVVRGAWPPFVPRGADEVGEKTPLPGGPLPQTAVPLEKNVLYQKLSGGKKKIYDVLANSPQGCTKAQIGFLSGLSYTSGSFATYLSELKRVGLIKQENDLYKVV